MTTGVFPEGGTLVISFSIAETCDDKGLAF
jgi:hypothetical protein